MKKRTRNILIIIGVVLLIFAGIIVYGVYKIYSGLDSVFNRVENMAEIPDEIKEARVLKGSDFLVKSEFFKLNQEGFLTIVGKGSQVKDEKEREKLTQSLIARKIYGFEDIKVVNNEIIAVGVFGGFIFDLNGTLKREIFLNRQLKKSK